MMSPLPIPLIPHFTNNEAGIVDAAECLSAPTQGVGLPPIHVKVQEPRGLYLVQDKVEAHHGETTQAVLIIFSFSASFPSSLPSPHSSSDKSESLSDLDSESYCSPLPSKYKDNPPAPAPPLSLRSFAATRSSSSCNPPSTPQGGRGHKCQGGE